MVVENCRHCLDVLRDDHGAIDVIERYTFDEIR
jgi:hypothetical protein